MWHVRFVMTDWLTLTLYALFKTPHYSRPRCVILEHITYSPQHLFAEFYGARTRATVTVAILTEFKYEFTYCTNSFTHAAAIFAHRHTWCQHPYYRVLTTAPHCFLVSHGQPFSLTQLVMNAAARVIMNLSVGDHLQQLHRLPVEQRILYKLCLLAHLIHTGQTPQCLTDCVSTVSAAGSRYRRRSTAELAVQTKFCQEQQRLDSFFLIKPPESVFRLICMNSVLFRSCLRRSWTMRKATPYKMS